MSRPLPRTSRRAALAALLGATATGCALTTTSESTSPSSSSTAGRSGSTSGEETKRTSAGNPSVDPGSADPDSDLVALVVADLSDAHARVRANRRAHPALADRLRGLERLHARHARELGGLVSAPAPAQQAERRRARVLPRITAVEDVLQQRLVDHAVAAESGALALLLAAMAAGLAQARESL